MLVAPHFAMEVGIPDRIAGTSGQKRVSCGPEIHYQFDHCDPGNVFPATTTDAIEQFRRSSR
jgi:hypothetical protein